MSAEPNPSIEFRNVWPSDGTPGPVSECVRCGAIVRSAAEMLQHLCGPKPAPPATRDDSALTTEQLTSMTAPPNLPTSATEPTFGQDDPAPPPTIPLAKPKVRVKFKCGHLITVACLESGSCAECAKKNRIRRFVEKEKAAKRPKTFPGFRRLPAGSVKTLTWNGTHWVGTLKIAEVTRLFSATADTELKCLHALHAEYTEWLRKPRPKSAPSTSGSTPSPSPPSGPSRPTTGSSG